MKLIQASDGSWINVAEIERVLPLRISRTKGCQIKTRSGNLYDLKMSVDDVLYKLAGDTGFEGIAGE